MRFIYDFIIFIYSAGIRIASLCGNQKARLWISGRTGWEEKIGNSNLNSATKKIWFHCASLGEFEQGRPLIEKIKLKDPSIFIILSFFSPSGFEVRKNYQYADLVCYLPADSKRNAAKFLQLVSPSFSIFIKYEYWLHYFEELKKRNIPLFLCSSVFNSNQIFFKSYGGFYRKILNNVTHFFLQDKNSQTLLLKLGYNNTTVTGDTRFDRVRSLAEAGLRFPIIETFSNKRRVIIAGSTWPEDERILFEAMRFLSDTDLKIIIAPHEVTERRIQNIIKKANELYNSAEIIRYSSAENAESARVLIIDNIGVLSSAYRYGTIAWIGGGFGKGIHNILEAAAFGMPVIFGPDYKKFREAMELISLSGAFSIRNSGEAGLLLNSLLNNDQKLKQSSIASAAYVNSNYGATDKILSLLPVQ